MSQLSESSPLALREAAAEWFLRRQHASWSAGDEAELQQWLAASTARRAAFERLESTWNDFAGVPRPVLASDARRSAAARPPQQPAAAPWLERARQAWRGWSRQAAFAPAACALVLLLLAGGWYRFEHAPDYALTLVTAAGELRQVQLPDGSQVELNGDSELRVRFDARRRQTELLRGEAFFAVAPDAARPFSVDQGASRVTVVGTRFNLRAGPPQLRIKVQEGRVLVLPVRRRPDEMIALGASQGLVVDADGSHRALATVADSVGDWRSGRLVFRRTPLADVADEIARYLGTPVVLADDARLRTLTVSGFADLAQPAVFLEALPDLLPLRLSRRPDGSYFLAAR